jgi:hypothetical protein
MLRTASAQAGVKLSVVKEIPEGLFMQYRNGAVIDVQTTKEGATV